MRLVLSETLVRSLSVLCALAIAPGDLFVYAQRPPSTTVEKILTATQLDSLVAPVALYPDPLLAQVLAASTYPLQIVEAERWLTRNPGLTGKALVQAAAEQDWEASIQALVAFPTVLHWMSENLAWTSQLGNAFLAQQEAVMQAVQSMRAKARYAGVLKSNAQQKIEKKKIEDQSVIVIEAANPQVVYVPSYNPTIVYGAAPLAAPYPWITYPQPPPTGTMVAASAISFGAGVALGAIFSGCCGYSGWGWGFHWGPYPSLYVNHAFLGRYGFAAPIATPYGAWTHNPYYRGAMPYSSAAVADRYGYGRAAATPYGWAAGVRTPYGSAGAVTGANAMAAAVRTPYGSVGAGTAPYGNAAGVKTFGGTTVKTSGGGTYSTGAAADRSRRGSSASDWAGSRSFGSWGSGARSGFSDSAWGGDRARMASDRGFGSLGGFGGRWGHGGGFGRGFGRR